MTHFAARAPARTVARSGTPRHSEVRKHWKTRESIIVLAKIETVVTKFSSSTIKKKKKTPKTDAHKKQQKKIGRNFPTIRNIYDNVIPLKLR